MEGITHGAGAEVAEEVLVVMIRRRHTITNRLGDRRHRQQELRPVSKGTGLDSGPVRWAARPLVILLATEAETSKCETKAGAIRKGEDSLEEQIKVEVSSVIMQEKEVRCGADGVVLDLPDPRFRLRGTKALVLDPPVADESLRHKDYRRSSVFSGVWGIRLAWSARMDGRVVKQRRT